MRRYKWVAGLFILALGSILASCSPSTVSPSQPGATQGQPLLVVTTTTIVGDVVKNIAGNRANVQILIPAGVDEHSFQYTPADVTKVANADIVFMNGAGLETFMKPLMSNADAKAPLVSVSDGIQLSQAKTDVRSSSSSDQIQVGDPHVWMDPNLVKVWTENIASALSQVDPEHAADYENNKINYQQQLIDLDQWIRDQISQVPPANRLLVTDHEIFTYFADRYGFQQIGAVIPSYSTTAEPSARELAALEDAIRQYGVKAIFVGDTVNPALASRVADDTGTKLIRIYTGSLTPGPPAGTYLDYMRSDVEAIVGALK